MRFDIFTLFPSIFASPLQESILKRALEAGLITVQLHNIRDYAADRHHVTDDYPYGGGGGMVMKPEPIFAAVESVLGNAELRSATAENVQHSAIPILLLTPQGRLFTQSVARELAGHERIALICGRYEGVDERVRAHLATDEISIGDYVLTGGELPALVILDAVARLQPGVLGDAGATAEDSHAQGLLEYPHYTRPPEFRGWKIPEVLLSGHHAEIERWRRRQSLLRTWQRRPDLLARAALSPEERQFLEELARAAGREPGGRPPKPLP
ncbi:MAG TPA: tRNA (guanosine(37)-N1)-methyltransferase TrmD [Anaerolineae bacterium]|nr:tRNA (guanosine(37)-N1)-methyltransferase TrmD [Anaerolineae bacterium]